jgi:DNA-binding MarR family transcriptional regulator
MEKKLVVKQTIARDARVSLVKLTNVGAEIHSNATASFKLATQTAFGTLDQTDLDALGKAIGKLK